MPVSSLSTFQKAAQRKAFTEAALGALRPQFTAADAPALLALILHDAATYDPVTKTGGYDGSILLSRWVEQSSLHEYKGNKPKADTLRHAKCSILLARVGPQSSQNLQT